MQVEVTDADREAAQALCASGWTHAIDAFARHRIAERERVVGEICEFLRDYPAEMYKRDIAYTIAHRIEAEFGGRD